MPIRRNALLHALLSLYLILPPSQGQDGIQPDPEARFEVASIHRNNRDEGWNARFTPDGFVATGISLQYLIEEAFGIYDERRLMGGAPWLASTKFDIQARFDAARFKSPPTVSLRREMLQNLLKDRFGLIVHHEKRNIRVYALIVSKGGPKLSRREEKHSDEDNNTPDSFCKHVGRTSGYSDERGCSMEDLASELTFMPDVGRTVVDRTGLAGKYDFQLRWAPGNSDDAHEVPTEGPSIFLALEEELGLRLVPATTPVDVIAIDVIKLPTEN